MAPGSARWSRPVGTIGSASSAAMPAVARRFAAFVDERGCVAAWNPSRNQPSHPPLRVERHGHPDNESAGATYGVLQGRSAHSPKERAQPHRRGITVQLSESRTTPVRHMMGLPADAAPCPEHSAHGVFRRMGLPPNGVGPSPRCGEARFTPSSRYQQHDRRGIRPASCPHLVPT